MNVSKNRIICRRCKNHTNHDVLESVVKTFTPDGYKEMQIDFAKGIWEILECCGCGEITFRETWFTSEDYCDATGELRPTVKFYPYRGEDIISNELRFVIPASLNQIYDETIDSYNSGNNILCAAGIRALIDGAFGNLNEDSVKRENLKSKIERMVEGGFLTRKNADSLHELRFLGNEALHELQAPSKDELRIAFDIINLTLENLFSLTDKKSLLSLMRRKRSTK